MQYFAFYFALGLVYASSSFFCNRAWSELETPDFQLGLIFLLFVAFWPLCLIADGTVLIGKTLKRLVKK